MTLLLIPPITYISSLTLIIPIIIGIINVKTIHQTPLKIIFYYCFVFAFYEIVGWVYAINGWRNHFLANSVAYTDVLFWGYYYYLVIKERLNRRFIVTLSIVTLSVVIWVHVGHDYNRVNSLAVSMVNITMIIIALMFFYQLLNSLEVENLFKYAHFWIGIAVLVFFSGVFFMLIFADYISYNKNKNIVQYWYLKDYLLSFHRIFLGAGLWYSKELVQSKTSVK